MSNQFENPFEQPKENIEDYFADKREEHKKKPKPLLSCSEKATAILAYYGQRSNIPLDSEFWELMNRHKSGQACLAIPAPPPGGPPKPEKEAEEALKQANKILEKDFNGQLSAIPYPHVYWSLMNLYRELVRRL